MQFLSKANVIVQKNTLTRPLSGLTHKHAHTQAVRGGVTSVDKWRALVTVA